MFITLTLLLPLILFLSIIFKMIMMKYLGWGDWKISFFDSLIASLVSSISTIIFIFIPGFKYAASLDGFVRPAAIVLTPAIILLGVVVSILIEVYILFLIRHQPLSKLLWVAIIIVNGTGYLCYSWYFLLVAEGTLRLST